MKLSNKSSSSPHVIRSKKLVFLTVAALVFTACGGSHSDSSSPDTTRSRNSVLSSSTAATCATGGACVVGDTGPGGGKVFYVAPTTFTSTGSECGTTCNYLEAAPIGWIKAATPAGQTNCAVAGTSTTDPECVWSGNTTTAIGTTSNAIGAGYANTSAMIAQSNIAGRAATVARAFQGGGKTDWSLPSKDELNQMYLQKSVLGIDYIDRSTKFWSSSEFEASNSSLVRFQFFYNGYQSYDVKENRSFVRPVRAFSGLAAVTTTTTTTTTTTIAKATTSTSSCATGGVCRVGDTGPGGGKVFYVAPTTFTSTGSACGTACKYLEAAPIGWIKAATPAGQTNCKVAGTSTKDPKCEWSGNIRTRIGTTSNAIGAGYANTSAIIAQSNVAGMAATVARAFQGGGKTDWSLPSKDELTQMYLRRSALGGFGYNYYWSSSELDASKAWFQGFDGYGDNGPKQQLSQPISVRPVRAFSDSATVAAPVTTSTSSTTTTVAATTLTCATGGACVVGDTGPGGGKVFYVAPTTFTSTGSECGTACKYLEAAPIGWITAATPAGQTNCMIPGTSTKRPECLWALNTTTAIGTTSTVIGAGYANTAAMIAQSNVAGRAATVARAFQGGGKTDWSLPSKDELNQMYLQRNVLGISAFGSMYFWSSSEDDASRAWRQSFLDGTQNSSNKLFPSHVNPVRAF